MIKVTLTNEMLKRISAIDEKRFSLGTIELPQITQNRLRKNSKKKSSYASNKIEGNPLTEACTLGPVQIWRGFFRRGHRLTQTCTGCGMVYYIGYHMPDGHGDGRDPACAYCAMDTVCTEFAGDAAK